MFPDYQTISPLTERSLRPDRRPYPRASEIRLRVKRTLSAKEA